MTQKFQGKQLDLLEANFNAQKENNQKKSDSLQKNIRNPRKKKIYLRNTICAQTSR